MLFQTSDTTWQAYNSYGGNSLYTGSPAGRAYKVSYNRPFNTRVVDGGQDWVFNAEYPMVRWLEANGYDVSYTTGVDSDRRGALIRNHRVFLSVGHDEYWSGGQRANVEAARNAGVHLAFFSGNEVFWKTRWENSIDGSNTPFRTLVTYKETHAGAKIDPTPAWTGTWRDPRFSPPADGGRPENELTGHALHGQRRRHDLDRRAGRGREDALLAQHRGRRPGAEHHRRRCRTEPWATSGTSTPTTARVRQGSSACRRRQSRMRRCCRTSAPPSRSGTAIHSLTLYRHASGALVFGAGTVQWAWGLDATHDRAGTPTNASMQQATVNLFADMGVQPATLRPGLVAATASSDTAAPTSVVTSPGAGTTVPSGQAITISGTASDAGGGVVGGVEVSVDGGTTWRRANGRESWTLRVDARGRPGR